MKSDGNSGNFFGKVIVILLLLAAAAAAGYFANKALFDDMEGVRSLDQAKIIGRGVVGLAMQPMGVVIVRILAAQLRGPFGHLLRELGNGTGNVLRQGGGRVIRRLDQECM